jgi:hypothetical protein
MHFTPLLWGASQVHVDAGTILSDPVLFLRLIDQFVSLSSYRLLSIFSCHFPNIESLLDICTELPYFETRKGPHVIQIGSSSWNL